MEPSRVRRVEKRNKESDDDGLLPMMILGFQALLLAFARSPLAPKTCGTLTVFSAATRGGLTLLAIEDTLCAHLTD